MKFYTLLMALFLMTTTCIVAQAQDFPPGGPQGPVVPDPALDDPDAGGPAYAPAPPPVAVAKPYCREYTQKLTIAGKTQNGYGTACLQPDGSWELQPAAKKVSVETPQGEVVQTVQPIRYVTRGGRVYVMAPQPYVIMAPPPPVVVIGQPDVVILGGDRHRHWH